MSRRVIAGTLAAALLGACGGGNESSGLSEDQIARALHLRYEGNDLLYESRTANRTCIVLRVLTAADEVKDARGEAGAVDVAVATNDAGDAGVEFGGFTGHAPDDCVPDAKRDLNALTARERS